MLATTAWYMAGTVIIPETLTGYAVDNALMISLFFK
jgi:hypothetical protein